MQGITQKILEDYQVRKTKKQKQAFRDFVIPQLEAQGYSVTVEPGSLGAKNILIGDPDRAKVIYTAHYDTCARLPFPNFITPKNFTVYLLYQLLLVIGMLAVITLVSILAGLIHINLIFPAYYLTFLALFWLVLAGPANPHTVNDNTSGVTAILELARTLPEEQREKAAFVLFDLEEAGLWGSMGFASRHPKIKQDTPVVNLDCVSDGRHILFAISKKARPFGEKLEQAFPAQGEFSPVFSKSHHIYPSDQANFKKGIGVVALNQGLWGVLYMNRIHTPKDIIYQEDTVSYVVTGCVRLTELI